MIGKVGTKVDETRSTTRTVSEKGAGGGAAGPSGPAPDTVELTSRAQLLERIEKSLASQPAVNSERVAEIRNAIENGNYQIDAAAIADAMLRFERSTGK